VTTTKGFAKVLDQLPWFILLTLVLLANVALNSASLNIRVANAITQMLLYFVIGYKFWREKSVKDAFNVFLMTGVFVISTMVTWFSPPSDLLTVSVWGLMLLQVGLAAATLTGYSPVKSFAGAHWNTAALFIILLLAAGGAWTNLIGTGLSQGLLWNMAVSVLCIGYIMNSVRQANQSFASFLKLAALIIAVTAAFGFSGLALTLFP
jgi:hypothetical protein